MSVIVSGTKTATKPNKPVKSAEEKKTEKGKK